MTKPDAKALSWRDLLALWMQQRERYRNPEVVMSLGEWADPPGSFMASDAAVKAWADHQRIKEAEAMIATYLRERTAPWPDGVTVSVYPGQPPELRVRCSDGNRTYSSVDLTRDELLWLLGQAGVPT